MNRKCRFVAAILLAALAPTLLLAEDATPPANPAPDPLGKYDITIDLGPTGEAVRLSLAEAVQLAIKNNLGVEVSRYSLRSARESELVQDAAFDSVFFGNIPLKREKSISTSTGTPFNLFTSEVGYTLGIRKRLHTGAMYSVSVTDDFSEYNISAPGSRAGLVVSVSQPLLRNFGRSVNTAQLEIAANSREIARKALEDTINSLVFDVTNAYWNLDLARNRLQVALQGMDLAKGLYRTTENLVRSGSERQLSLLRAEAGVASREDSVHLARLAVRSAEDSLKLLLNLNGDGTIPNSAIELADRPSQVESAFAFDECVDFALTRRPDLMQLRIGLASQKIALDVAKNQLKPRFDFSASIALTGMSYDYGEHFEGMVRGDYYAFKLGFDLEYPIGNRAAQAGLRKAESDFSKTKIALLAAEQGVILQVRNLVRTVRTNYRRINSAIIARRLAEQSLSEEQDRYSVGRSTAIEVLRLQTDLIAAQNTELQAIIDYNVSIAQLNRARAANALLYRVEVDSQREPVLALPSWDETAPDKPLIKASSQDSSPNK